MKEPLLKLVSGAIITVCAVAIIAPNFEIVEGFAVNKPSSSTSSQASSKTSSDDNNTTSIESGNSDNSYANSSENSYSSNVFASSGASAVPTPSIAFPYSNYSNNSQNSYYNGNSTVSTTSVPNFSFSQNSSSVSVSTPNSTPNYSTSTNNSTTSIPNYTPPTTSRTEMSTPVYSRPTTSSTSIPIIIPATSTTTTTTATTTTSRTTITTSQPAPVQELVCKLNVNSWGNGANINVTISNLSAKDIDGWQLVVQVPNNSTINGWQCTFNKPSTAIAVFSPETYNSLVKAGDSITFGFNCSSENEVSANSFKIISLK